MGRKASTETKKLNKSITKKSVVTKNEHIYIYGIFVKSKIVYVGQTSDIEKRWENHRKDIMYKQHSIKALNSLEQVDGAEFKVLCHAPTSNSLITFILESLYNSFYQPKNRIIWQVTSRRFASFARIPSDLADILIDTIVTYYNGNRYDK